MPPAPDAAIGLSRRAVLQGGALAAGLLVAIELPWSAALSRFLQLYSYSTHDPHGHLGSGCISDNITHLTRFIC